MTFSVTVLGNGSAKPVPDRHHSAHVLNVHEQFYLVDCGEGTQRRLVAAGVSPMRLSCVFISHLHGDHVYGLFPLISTMALMGRATPLRLFAPHPISEIVERHIELYDLRIPFPLEITEIDTRASDEIYGNSVMTVTTVPLRHRVPAAGFLFRERMPALNVSKDAVERFSLSIEQILKAKSGENVILGDGTLIPNERITYRPYAPRSFAYCSDTVMSGKVASIVSGADLLYHEATFLDEDRAKARENGHSTALQAAKTAVKAGVGRLIIGHFSSRYRNTDPLLEEARSVFAETYLAQEGMTYSVPALRSDR